MRTACCIMCTTLVNVSSMISILCKEKGPLQNYRKLEVNEGVWA